jgi:hypothetical protein
VTKRNALRAGVVLLLAVCAAVAAQGQSRQGLGMTTERASGSERVVLEEHWAAWLSEALGLSDALGPTDSPQIAFDLLCADRAGGDAPFQRVRDLAPPARGTERFVLEVPRTGLYALTVEGRGRQRWTINGRALEHIEVSDLGVAVAPRLLPLRAGPHEFAVYMASTSRLDRMAIEVARNVCVAPVDGWHAGRPLSHGAAARTLVRALGVEPLLPAAGASLSVARSDLLEPSDLDAAEDLPDMDVPLTARFRFDVDTPGIHTIEARVRGRADQIWLLDDLLRTRVRPQGDGPVTMHVVTSALANGAHTLRVIAPAASAIDEIRVTRRETGSADELALIEALGFVGRAPATWVTRSEALGHLASPVFIERAARFAQREALRGPAEPVLLVERQAPAAYARPLSPVLPGDL